MLPTSLLVQELLRVACCSGVLLVFRELALDSPRSIGPGRRTAIATYRTVPNLGQNSGSIHIWAHSENSGNCRFSILYRLHILKCVWKVWGQYNFSAPFLPKLR